MSPVCEAAHNAVQFDSEAEPHDLLQFSEQFAVMAANLSEPHWLPDSVDASRVNWGVVQRNLECMSEYCKARYQAARFRIRGRVDVALRVEENDQERAYRSLSPDWRF